jgi:nucleotide-binding universal stress UspA family protein
MLRKILVGLDGSPVAETILDPVRALAERLAAEVVLLHVIHVPQTAGESKPGVALDEIVAQERARAETYLDAVARKIAAGGSSVRTATRVGQPATEIVRYAEGEKIALVALATHGRSAMQRWLHGSVADAVLHTTTTPLLLLRPREAGAPATRDIRRLLVPLDGSSVAEAALGVAEELARALAVPMVLLRAVEPGALAFADPMTTPYADFGPILAVLREDAERYLAKVATDLRAKGLTVETLACVDTAVGVITRQAAEGGTLLVLSTHGRTGWRALVLGSVARRVVLFASGPVLVVRPEPSPAQPRPS